MSRIPNGLLASALLALAAAAQDGVQEKGAPAAKEGQQPAAVQGTAPNGKGTAPVRVQLGETVQPTQLQTRDGGRIDADPRAKYRTVVKMMINIDRAHRDRVARLERLRVLFQAAGASDKLSTVQRLRELEQSRYEAALQGYARGLGPDLYPQVRAVIDGNGGPAPAGAVAAPDAGSAPAETPAQGEAPAQGGAARGARKRNR